MVDISAFATKFFAEIEVLTEKAHYNNYVFTDNLGVTAVTKAETVDKISLKSL